MTTNPTRNSYSFNNHHQIPISGHSNNEPFHIQVLRTTLTSLKFFLKKPHAFPFLLFIFLVLTWVSLRMQHHHSAPNFSQSSSDSLQLQQNKWSSTKMDEDRMANLVRFSSSGFPSVITKDKRGWLLNPISIALRADISGTAVTCTSVHVGEIRPGGMRGNHKHHTCNETFVIWGAATVFRGLEDLNLVVVSLQNSSNDILRFTMSVRGSAFWTKSFASLLFTGPLTLSSSASNRSFTFGAEAILLPCSDMFCHSLIRSYFSSKIQIE